MTTVALRSVLVELGLLDALETVLAEAETVEAFVEASVRASVERRCVQAESIVGGLHSLDETRRSGDCVDDDAACNGLQRKLDAARMRIAGSQE